MVHLKGAQGFYQSAGMADGQDIARVAMDFVDDSVWGKDDFANLIAGYFWDNPARKGKVGKPLGGIEDVVMPFEGGLESVTHGNVPDNAI